MATKIVNLCDPHMAADVEVPGTPVEVTIGRAAYQVDLCAEDYDTYVKPLFALMTEHGRKVTADGRVTTTRPLTPEVCRLCPDGSPPMSGNVALATHLRRTHGMTRQDYNVRLGLAEPSTHVCYVCPGPKDLGTATGLSSHGRSVHGLGKGKFGPANEAAKAEHEAGKPAGESAPTRRKR